MEFYTHFSNRERPHSSSCRKSSLGLKLASSGARDGARAARAIRAADEAPLGMYAKFASAPAKSPQNPYETRFSVITDEGEILSLLQRKNASPVVVADPRQARFERFSLKSVVNRLLPNSRTSKCMRWKVPKRDVEVWKGQGTGKAYYKGLQVCASVWRCPVCAAKISQRRGMEVLSAIEEAKRQGLQPYLLTLTVPHGLSDPLVDTLTKLRKAWRYMQSDRAGKAFWSRAGVEGHIRALEVTDGDNGWHPHLHILLFVGTPEPFFKAQREASKLWQHCATKAGLPTPHAEYGCRLDDGSKAAQYVSKWGIESEITKGHVKKTKAGNSIWDLLRKVRDGDEDKKRCAARFVEFAEAFHGQKQLVWSKGLKDRLKVEELDDEAIAEAEADESSIALANLSDEQWDKVLYAKMESAILDLAETAPDAIPLFLAALPPRPDRARQRACELSGSAPLAVKRTVE